MDSLYSEIEAVGCKFNRGDQEIWRKLYEPFVEPPPAGVEVLRDESYGPDERHKMDIYVPGIARRGKPVLIFFHGGAFIAGDKSWSEKFYSNIGFFFSSHGIITVVANHRLVPHVQYPGGADDVHLVREWTYGNIGLERYGHGSPDKVVLVGHSSGGAHIAMDIYAAGDPSRRSSFSLFPPVAGVMYLSVPFHFDRTKPTRRKTLQNYFGSDVEEVWEPRSPLGLFRRLPENSPLFDPRYLPVYVGVVKWDMKETADAAIAFINAYREKSKPKNTLPLFSVLDRHNHISNILSIGTEDMSQSSRILDFIHTCTGIVEEKARQSGSKI